MIDRSNHEDRRKLLAGDRAGALTPEEDADVTWLADLLADATTWAEPSPQLEDKVVRAVADGQVAEPPQPEAARRPGPWRWRLLAAAAAVAIVGAAIATTVGRRPGAEFTAQLAATQVVPGAYASAAISPNGGGFRIALHAHGLAPLPDGQYYEAWLKNSSGTLIPAGTFSSSNDRVTLWSGRSPADFPIMTVTIEADDNNQASSGHVVLTGVVRGNDRH